MSAEAFIDTNILVYAFAGDEARRPQARRIVAAGGVVSVQVLNEFVDAARRKLRQDWPQVQEALASLSAVLDPPLPLTHETHALALDIAERYRLQIYDALILSAAKLAGCRVLYSEDMQHGQAIEGVVICNPFIES